MEEVLEKDTLTLSAWILIKRAKAVSGIYFQNYLEGDHRDQDKRAQ